MGIENRIRYADIDELFLDPLNPRLGRENTSQRLSQEKVLDLMQDWTLEELATSYLESGGFWVQESLLATKEMWYGAERLIVIEGNRRFAALKLLKMAYEGKPASRAWSEIIKIKETPETLFKAIPYIYVDGRKDVEAFLGFRHVTGIKEWAPAEKAEFIAKLVEENSLPYADVSRRIR